METVIHGHPFILVMNAPSRALTCQLEIWIRLSVPECCAQYIDICGACGHLAEGFWCRFFQTSLGIVHIIQGWEEYDGYFTTTIAYLWHHFIFLFVSFTYLVNCITKLHRNTDQKFGTGGSYRWLHVNLRWITRLLHGAWVKLQKAKEAKL